MHPAHRPGHLPGLDCLTVQRYGWAAVDEPAGAFVHARLAFDFLARDTPDRLAPGPGRCLPGGLATAHDAPRRTRPAPRAPERARAAQSSSLPRSPPPPQGRMRLAAPLRAAAGTTPAGNPAPRCKHRDMPRWCAGCAGCLRWRAVAQHPRHRDQPRSPLVSVLAALRITPPTRTPHTHGTIRTHARTGQGAAGAQVHETQTVKPGRSALLVVALAC
jgi:hypothetical protein